MSARAATAAAVVTIAAIGVGATTAGASANAAQLGPLTVAARRVDVRAPLIGGADHVLMTRDDPSGLITTTTPTLQASIGSTGGWWFEVYDGGEAGREVDSGWISGSQCGGAQSGCNWTIPTGNLEPGHTYVWNAENAAGQWQFSQWQPLRVDTEPLGIQPTDSGGPLSFAIG